MRRGRAGGRVGRGDGSADEERVCGEDRGVLGRWKNHGIGAVGFGAEDF